MIRIKFKEPNTRMWKRWLTDCDVATREQKIPDDPTQPIEVTDLYRRTSIKKAIYLAKAGPFRGRCVYCESNIADFQHGDIEHFRPKKGVTYEDDKPVMIGFFGGKELYHRGYYWLAYSWRNLLPSCITCNQPGEEGIGKRNRFPVEGHRYATRKEEIDKERPLLFNPIDPEDEDPEEHLGIDLQSGLMTMKNGSKRAEACIAIFGLNKRDQLVQERKNAMEAAKSKCIEAIYASVEKVPQIRREIEEMEQGHLNYTLARRAQIKDVKERLR